jgi:carboxymethylenebutenolidase
MGEWISVAMRDGYAQPVWRVAPVGDRKGSLILLQEIFGVTDHIRECCDEYAAEGYEVISPALFDRTEPGFEAGYSGEDWKRAVEMGRERHPMEQSLADTSDCIKWLAAQHPDSPLYIMGFCYGGSIAWRMAQTEPALWGASCFYGGHIATRYADEAPLCATIAHFGRFDSLVEFAPVEKLIEKQHPTAQIFVYEAGHGFNSDRRKDYHPPSAELAKARTLQLFQVLSG